MKIKPNKPKLDVFVKKAVEYGAIHAKIISANSLITAPWVRLKCQFGCGGFNSNLCCPPFTPTPDEMQKIIHGYEHAILIHCREMKKPTEIVVKLEKDVFLSGYYKALGLGAGPCTLCNECNKQKCARPEETRPSMEACGIDVYATVTGCNFPIQVLIDSEAEGNYFGLVLVE
ncbi:MAG: DUF2284 domain-containing protein [Candidatus Ozemobacteraceae bacterium]